MASQGLQDGSDRQDRAVAGPNVDLGEVEHIQGVTINCTNNFYLLNLSQKCLPGDPRHSCSTGTYQPDFWAIP